MRGCVAARQAEGTGALQKEVLAARQGSSALQCCSPMVPSLTATWSQQTNPVMLT